MTFSFSVNFYGRKERLKGNPILFISSVVIKIIPCIVLTVVSLRLINSLMEAKRKKQMLKRPVAGGQGLGRDCSGGDRTTRMLLAVLLLFLGTEFPQGILGLLSVLLDESFFRTCYIPLGDILDFAALSNSALNFILYAAMSNKFRQTFVETFCLQRICRKTPNCHPPETSTANFTCTTGV
jgi:hypothetical protein